jgi:hypothetical protein
MISNTSKNMNLFYADIEIVDQRTESDKAVFQKMNIEYQGNVCGLWGKWSFKYWTTLLHGVHPVKVLTSFIEDSSDTAG